MSSGQPLKKLPLDSRWNSEDEYVESLLHFATSSDVFRSLCGGVHILDFLTREPDLYTTVLPADWRDWFARVTIDDVLELLLRRDLNIRQFDAGNDGPCSERGYTPPESLTAYVDTVRKHCLQRQFAPARDNITMPRHISVGMKPKKIHEVTNFAAYVDRLSADVSKHFNESVSVVDFGSGQNYLGRTLACPPYHKHVIAIERRHHNIDGARGMDVHAKLAKKEKIMRNKKEYKRRLAMMMNSNPVSPEEANLEPILVPDVVLAPSPMNSTEAELDPSTGSITYIEHDIQDGYLENILNPPEEDLSIDDQAHHRAFQDGKTDNNESLGSPSSPRVMVISLHSCGNLVHHGLRSLILNPSVCAVAMIGCCYNLLTERLGPVTYKLPQLRPNHPRLEATGSAYDPHGFPMSKTLENFQHEQGQGVKLNITARMMAVQAPHNWGPGDSEAFFQRHFYRALLQRILLDRGVVKQCSDPDSVAGGSLSGKDTQGTPLIIGSLRKACFSNFRTYLQGALSKLKEDPVDGPMIHEKTRDLTDEVADEYEAKWWYAKKNLAVIWSLMAFSAGVVESIIAVDRWLYLREQDSVADCWVEPVFDYKYSPRNLVVVGIKKKDG